MAALGMAGTLTAGSALAQAQGLLEQALVVQAGAFAVGTGLKANLNGQSSRNPEVDFDEAFGTDARASRARLGALWRITPHHQLRFGTFSHGQTRSKVIDRDFHWGNYTFKANASVESQVKVQVYELAYEYAFLRRPDLEVAASIGVHSQRLSTRLTGQATIAGSGGGGGAVTKQTQSNAVSAPLPMIGLRANWAVAPQWLLEGRVQALQANVGDVDGHWNEARLGATWMFHRNFGLGLAYSRFQTRLDIDRARFDGSMAFGYRGLQTYLTGAF